MDLNQILDLIRQHGDIAYALVFAHAATNSLLTPLFAGYAAHADAFDWGTLVLVCWAGSFVGDAVRFWIGRRFGTRWLGSFPRIQRAVETSARLIDRHYLWMILLHRYPHGIRGLAGFAFGVSQLSWSKFLILNGVSAGLWAATVVSIGYAFGDASEKMLSDGAAGVSLALLLVFLGAAWLLTKKLDPLVKQG